ncbi:hypothetical protein AJ79_09740 [Helicocarpus griseus UAMH5409]|uniref:Lytic polysaccharide monooxygenase n=1 Tax=Helicocarpus griseus UAMH5409 TaxID=1447875 RepID=A0A2B7W966_9EURO|nr:hypothetical protein AJ79_09740 [Helicocarpus griseus UAMH5409]
MHFSPSVVAAAAALLSASTVNAHMKMKTPVPFNFNALDNGPLDASGSDFPCKFDGSYSAQGGSVPPENVMAIGEEQILSFQGSAVHGGGSCQLSITEDKVPTKQSVWKVIHSIEGGCPAAVEGNLPENAYGSGASTFKFKIPDVVAPGDYTFAWTWLNRIGNREFYMNCAPITVTGGKKRRYTPTPPSKPVNSVSLAKRDELPEMFVANINGCMTKEGVDIRFPEPGPSVDLFGVLSNLISPGEPACTPSDGSAGPIAGEGGAPGSYNPGSGGSGGSSPSSSPAPTPSHTTPEKPPAVSPGFFATQAPQAPPAPPAAPATPPTQQPPSGQYGGGNAAPSGDGSSKTGPCTNEGEWNCIGGSQFQRCASGQWSVAMPMAAGTKCTPGSGPELAMAAIKKRGDNAMHRRRGHYLQHMS